jgi:prepilin-type N-terminal cleavage/methylation domain-containing protein
MKITRRIATALGGGRGFTLVEVLVASMILVVALLSLSAMFPVGYRQITDAGRMTMAVTGARHILEDIGDVPFANISNLNNFDTSNVGSLPANNPEQAIARRWRYMLAGPGDGFTFTGAETTAWGPSTSFGGRAQVQVANTSATLRTVTVTVTVPGLAPNVTVSTVIVRMF